MYRLLFGNFNWLNIHKIVIKWLNKAKNYIPISEISSLTPRNPVVMHNILIVMDTIIFATFFNFEPLCDVGGLGLTKVKTRSDAVVAPQSRLLRMLKSQWREKLRRLRS